MNGDPLDPITFEQAIYGICQRLRAGALPEVAAVRGGSNREEDHDGDAAGHAHQTESDVDAGVTVYAALLGLVAVGGIRAWVPDGNSWKRPTPTYLQASFRKEEGEPIGLYLDSHEVTSTIAQWPDVYGRFENLKEQPSTEAEPKPPPTTRKVGRPKGPGYALADVATFKLILEAQRQSGDVRTEHFLINKFAGDPNANDFSTNVDRLRRGLPNWLVEIGEQWRCSN